MRGVTELKTNVISAAECLQGFCLLKLVWQPVPEGGCSIAECKESLVGELWRERERVCVCVSVCV